MKFLNVFLVLALLTGCASTQKVQMTPMEIQSLQTRDFESTKKITFASVVSVLQDLGYSVNNADLETGIINAESTAQSDAAMKFWLGQSHVTQTKVTAFVEEIGKTTKVRLNFVSTKQVSYSYGQTDRDDTPLLDAKIYQNAFEKIENAVFVRSSSN